MPFIVSRDITENHHFTGSIHVLAGEYTNYYSFTREIARRIPGEGGLYFHGYPTIYWGLQQAFPERRYVEAVALRGDTDASILDSVKYVIFTRSSDPVNDARDAEKQRSIIDLMCPSRGESLVTIDSAGPEEKYAYSGRIFAIRRVGR